MANQTNIPKAAGRFLGETRSNLFGKLLPLGTSKPGRQVNLALRRLADGTASILNPIKQDERMEPTRAQEEVLPQFTPPHQGYLRDIPWVKTTPLTLQARLDARTKNMRERGDTVREEDYPKIIGGDLGAAAIVENPLRDQPSKLLFGKDSEKAIEFWKPFGIEPPEQNTIEHEYLHLVPEPIFFDRTNFMRDFETMADTDPKKYRRLAEELQYLREVGEPEEALYKELFAIAGQRYGKRIFQTPIGKYYKNVLQE